MTLIINSIPALQPVNTPLLTHYKISASVLRLDGVHPVVSGNKWYKLQNYIAAAKVKLQPIVTFGGAYSNHIVATAAACTAANIPCAGIIRGERPERLSPTLQDAKQYGMQLLFISRERYRKKEVPEEIQQQFGPDNFILVPEGGYGIEGMQGAATILDGVDFHSFDHIVCAVGTGTTLAGLVAAKQLHQQVTGFSVMKGNFELTDAVRRLLPNHLHESFTILHEYHQGGYAKHNPQLLQFMNRWYGQTGIPSDFVYTGKMLFAFTELCQSGYFGEGSNVLLVHSGGLQGNRSLPQGTLIF